MIRYHAGGAMGKISLILPVYNEAAILQEVLAKYITELKTLSSKYEIIAVNDGSTDGSEKILMDIAKMNRNLRIINLDGRYGKQAAITAGMDAFADDAEVVLLADVDILNPVGALKRVLAEYKKGGQPIVYARRDNMSAQSTKSIINECIITFGTKLFGIDGKYTGKVHIELYSRPVAEVIRALPERNKFVRAMDNWVGWNISYVTYPSGYNKIEEKYKIKEAAQRHIKNAKQYKKLNLNRDKKREHTASIDFCYAALVCALVMFIGAIVVAALNVEIIWLHIVLWMGAVLLTLVAGMFYVRAVLVKRVGLLHSARTENIYVIRNVIN